MPTIHSNEWEVSEIQSQIDEIRRDRASGAATLTLRAARLLIGCAENMPEEVPAIARALMAAQPAMGPVCNLAWRALSSPNVTGACHGFLEWMEQNAARVAETAAGLIKDGMTVMTHSFSSTVLAAFREASRRGRRFKVICPESRPVCEGLAMAASLGMAGIDVSLIADAACYRLLPEVGCVWVGADAISPRGVFNKTGTALLALAARELKVPFYVLCASDKILPHSYDPPPETPKHSVDLLERELPHVTALHYHFDVTPLDFVTGVVTEDRILTPSELRERLACPTVPPDSALATLLSPCQPALQVAC